MCTLSHIPTEQGFILSNNRDEEISRPSADNIQQKNQTYFPQDLQAGGTWFSATKNLTVCLLNGGSIPYHRKEKYRHSRGFIPLDIQKYPNPQEFLRDYNLKDIEPFTLILRYTNQLFQLIHNEKSNDLIELDSKEEHIWSSTTLYSPELRLQRENVFSDWLSAQGDLNPQVLEDFHLRADSGLSLLYQGIKELKTLSFTQSIKDHNKDILVYQDLTKSSKEKLFL